RAEKRVFSHLTTDHYHYFYLGGEGHNSSFDSWLFERGQESDLWISRVDLPALPESLNADKHRRQNALNRMSQREEHEFSGPRCVRHAVEWLHDNRESDDWFLQVELFDPHEPFYVVPEYLAMYGDEWGGPIYDWPEYGEVKDDPAAVQHIRRCYAALLTMTDRWLGKLWDALDETDGWQDTMVVLTTDHGSMLGEHDYWMKNMMPVYNEIAHIPLIVHLPGDRRAGARVQSLTQTTDLMPTFLDYFQAPAPPHLHGVSLRPVLEGGEGESVHDTVIYGYFGMALNITDGGRTYFRNPVEGESLLYAYTSMPTAFHDFLPREQLAQAEMGRYLSHTYNIPVYKVPQTGKAPHRRADAVGLASEHELYDLASDPGQARPLADADAEERFIVALRTHLERVDAPPEQARRLGL
ncbi:MAG: sulfatase-like hydrolase/transferase, partial [Chloroflexia bacterium]